MLFGIQVRPAVGPGLTPNPFCIDIIRMQRHARVLYFLVKLGRKVGLLLRGEDQPCGGDPFPTRPGYFLQKKNRIRRQLVPKLSPQLWAGAAGWDGTEGLWSSPTSAGPGTLTSWARVTPLNLVEIGQKLFARRLTADGECGCVNLVS